MKIAICFAGHLRLIEETHRNLLDNLIKPNDADVFIHTWSMLGNDLNLRRDANLFGLQTTAKHIAFLNPARYEMETYSEDMFNVEEMLPRTRGAAALSTPEHMFKKADNMLAMFYGIRRSIEIKKEYEQECGFTYDVVIRCRPDLMLDEPIVISDINPADGIHVKARQTHEERLIHGIDDQIAFGPSNYMDIYGQTFWHLDDEANFVHNKFWYAEQSLFAWLNSQNVPIIPFDTKHRIKRPMGYEIGDREYGKYK